MMKLKTARLALSWETLRTLTSHNLATVRGGLGATNTVDTEPPYTFVECANTVAVCGISVGNCNITYNFTCQSL